MTTFLVRNVADPVRATSHDYGIWFMDRTVVTNALRRDPISFYDFTQFDYILEKTVDKKVLVGEMFFKLRFMDTFLKLEVYFYFFGP